MTGGEPNLVLEEPSLRTGDLIRLDHHTNLWARSELEPARGALSVRFYDRLTIIAHLPRGTVALVLAVHPFKAINLVLALSRGRVGYLLLYLNARMERITGG